MQVTGLWSPERHCSDVPTAQASIDETIQAQIYSWAYRFLRNHHDALDATQEVLVKWLRVRHQGVESRQAWLRKTTTNHCIDLLRKRRAPAFTPPEPVSHETPFRQVAQEELQHLVTTGLSRLSEQQRAVVVAKVYDSETFASIAASMRLSVSSVKTHYIRGLRAMRDALKGYHKD